MYYKKEWLKMSSDDNFFFKEKEEFRNFCKKKLKKNAKYNKIKNNFLVLESVEEILKKVKFRTILLYLPLLHEVNFYKIFPKLRKKGNLLVPFMQGVSFKVVKYRLPIFKKNFSISEPNNSLLNFSNIDVMIVPVIGVDGALRRIGFGKGMYDRYFNLLKTKPLVIFVQLEDCCTKHIVSESHDMQADIYVTPKKIIYKRGINGNRSKYNSSSCIKRRSRIFYS